MRLTAVVYVLLMRLMEIALSRRNAARAGARPVEGDGMTVIVAVHILWILGLCFEPRRFEPVQPFLVLFVMTEIVRFWCIAELGPSWNIRVLTLNPTPIRRGPYRFLRHPNYAAVVVGMVALPLGLGLVATPIVVLPLKLAALRRRIRVEDRRLAGGR